MGLLSTVHWWYALEVEATRQGAMNLCRESLSTLARDYKQQPPDDPSWEVLVKTDWSWRGFGELIWLRVSKLRPPLSRIDVSSHPYIQELAWDFGENRRNVEGILQFLQSQLEPTQISRIRRVWPEEPTQRTGKNYKPPA